MIRPDDLSVAADSLAANGTPAGPAGAVVHAAGVCTDTLDGGLRAAEALSDSFAAADSLVHTAAALPDAFPAAFPQVEPLSAAERALTLGGWLSDWTARTAQGVASLADASAAELFGAASTLGDVGHAVAETAAPLSGSVVYQAVVLLLAASYLLLLYTNYSEVRMLAGSFGFDRNAGQRTLQKRGVIHSHFLRRCCVLGVVGIGVLTVRLCDDWLPAGTFDALPPLWREGLCVAAVLAAEAVVLMQTIALWCIGQVTLTQSFVETLLYVKQFHFALASLSVLPFILLYALCPIGSGSGWLCGIVGLSATIILLFLREIHSLFVAKNISNLHWILYLHHRNRTGGICGAHVDKTQLRMIVTKVSRILVSQPQPAIPEKSPFFELARRQRITVDYHPFIRVAGVSLKEFRQQRVEILDHTAVIFTSRTTVDSFFRICEEARITVPETMKYICQTEAVALYLQKYIVYRKRKISFADGSFTNLIELLIKHKEEKFLLTLSEPHKPDLPETMAKLKFSFHPVILARTVAADPEGIDIRSYDVVGIYSPSEVKVLIEQFGDELPTIAAFGEATLRCAIEAGLTVKIKAPTPEAPSMVKAIDIYIDQVHAGKEVEAAQFVEDKQKEEFIRSQQHKLAKKSRARRSSADKK